METFHTGKLSSKSTPRHTSLHFLFENWIPQSQLGFSFAVQTFVHQISSPRNCCNALGGSAGPSEDFRAAAGAARHAATLLWTYSLDKSSGQVNSKSIYIVCIYGQLIDSKCMYVAYDSMCRGSIGNSFESQDIYL